MQAHLEKSNLYRAIAELAYVVAKADRVLDKQEVDAFYKIIKDTLGESDWLAEVRFEIMIKGAHPNIKQAYRHAIYLLEENKLALSDEIIEKFQTILLKVAEVSGICEEEREILEMFEKDLRRIYGKSLKYSFQEKNSS